jgi:hypothetical protein
MTTKQQATEALKAYVVGLPERFKAIQPEEEAKRLDLLAMMFHEVQAMPENYDERLTALIAAHDPSRETKRLEKQRQIAVERAISKIPAAPQPIPRAVLVAIAAAYCGTYAHKIAAGDRHRDIVRARSLACALLRWSGLSWPEVASAVGAPSHATAISSAQRADSEDVAELLGMIGRIDAKTPQPPPVAIAATPSPSSVTDDPRVGNEPQTHLAALQGE